MVILQSLLHSAVAAEGNGAPWDQQGSLDSRNQGRQVPDPSDPAAQEVPPCGNKETKASTDSGKGEQYRHPGNKTGAPGGDLIAGKDSSH